MLLIKRLFGRLSTVSGPVYFVILSALLFVWSKFFYITYLEEFGLNSQKMIRSSIHSQMLDGFLVSWSYFFYSVAFIWSGTALMAFGASIYFSIPLKTYQEKRDYVWLRAKVKKYTGVRALRLFFNNVLGIYRTAKKREATPFEEHAVGIFTIMTGFLFVCIGFVVTLAGAASAGQNKAEKTWEVFFSSPEKRLIALDEKGIPNELFLLACGSNNCAGIDMDTCRVHYFPATASYSYMLRIPERFLINIDEHTGEKHLHAQKNGAACLGKSISFYDRNRSTDRAVAQ